MMTGINRTIETNGQFNICYFNVAINGVVAVDLNGVPLRYGVQFSDEQYIDADIQNFLDLHSQKIENQRLKP